MTSPPPSVPGKNTPSTPPSNPTMSAASASPAAPSRSTQSTATADLAAVLAAPPRTSANVIKGVVTAANMTGSPPTISVTLQGDTTNTVSAVRFIDSYSPVIGDTVLLVKQGSDIFALGQMNDSASGVSNGWQTPTLNTGYTTNGNTNGNLQYRLVVDNGDNMIQWKGSVAVSSPPFSTLTTLPSAYWPSTKRSIIVPTSVQNGGMAAQIDFTTNGQCNFVLATTGATGLQNGAASPTSSEVVSISGTTGSDNANHSHTGTTGEIPSPSHGHSYSGSEGGHAHTISSSHSHSETNGSFVPTWIGLNGVSYYL